jgi:hypothetical protein
MNIPSSAALRRALTIQKQIERLQHELAGLFVSAKAPTRIPIDKGPGRRRRGKLSAAGRARIIAAQKARWAKLKGRKAAGKQGAKKKRKGKMSAAARAKLSAMLKARWALRKKQGKTKLG